jgi:hypothetical protein
VPGADERTPDEHPEQPVGDLGGGRGGTAASRPDPERASEREAQERYDKALRARNTRVTEEAAAALEREAAGEEQDQPISVEQVVGAMAKPKRGAKRKDPPPEQRREVAALRLANVSIAEIQRRTGLTKTVATRLVHDVDDAIGHIRAGRY